MFRKFSYPYTIKLPKFLEEDDENINNGSINENTSFNNLNERDEPKIIGKKIDFQNIPEEINEKNEIIIESQLLIPEIMKIYQKAKKFDYNFDIININFNDFIHNFSFENEDNKIINDIQNNNSNNFSNNISNDNLSKKKVNNESYSILSQTINNSSENNNNNRNSYIGKYILLENGKKQINKDLIKCNCKNSNCLKFYCECFSNGKYCEKCSCCNCNNKKEYENLRKEKYKNIISRNPKAILQINSTKKSWTCNCRNSNCTKKYCDCFGNGKSCTSKCKCLNCMNKISNSNNNSKKIKKIKRIRGGKKLLKNNIYLTPKKNESKRKNNNQSTTDLTENENNRKKIFNNLANNSKSKMIKQKLNMDDI